MLCLNEVLYLDNAEVEKKDVARNLFVFNNSLDVGHDKKCMSAKTFSVLMTRIHFSDLIRHYKTLDI